MNVLNLKTYPFLWAILSAIISIFAISKGPAIPTGDSLSYFNCAKSLEINFSHSFPFSELDQTGKSTIVYFEPNTIWPPATSFSLFLLFKLGISKYLGLQILIALFAAISIGLTWKLARLVTESNLASNIITLQLMTMWSFRYWVEESFMAEGIFIAFSMVPPLYIASLGNHSNFKLGNLLFAGFLFSLTYYIKSAAPAYILAGCMSVFIFSKQNRFKNLVLFSMGAGIGVLPWLLRNLSYGTIGSAGSGPFPNSIVLSVTEFIRLFIPRHGNFLESKIIVISAGLFLLSIGFIALLVILKKDELKRLINAFNEFSENNYLFLFTWIYVLVFVVVLMISIYVFKKTSFIEMRYWMELVPFIMPAVWIFIRDLYHNQINIRKKLVFGTSTGLLSLIIVLNIFEGIRNEERVWNRFPISQESNALDIHHSLGLNSNVRFFSNNHVKFETFSGLTDWGKVNDTFDFKGAFCYVAFAPELENTMLLEAKAATPPEGWVKISSLKDMEFYIDTNKVLK
jgi:hypothetical protein